jgi:hypothetical protein
MVLRETPGRKRGIFPPTIAANPPPIATNIPMTFKNKVSARNGATGQFERESFIHRWSVFVECLLPAGVVRDAGDDAAGRCDRKYSSTLQHGCAKPFGV